MIHYSTIVTYAPHGNRSAERLEKIETEMLFGEHDWIRKWVEYRPLPAKYPHGEPAGYDFQSIIDNALLLTINMYNERYITEIKIRVTDIAKGLKYNDLCISEIILLH